MTGRIFRNSFFIGIVTLLLAAALFCTVLYGHYEEIAYRDLRAAAAYIAHGMELNGGDYLQTMESENRVTWVAADGTVLYDSVADVSAMGNHLDREEIAEALEQGSGRSEHDSKTLMQKTLYYACLLQDGTVLRVSCSQSSAVSMLWELAPSLLGIVALMLALAGFLSFRLAKKITRPINEIDLDQPQADSCYRELRPLIGRLTQQSYTIHRQMEELSRRQKEFAAISDNMNEALLVLDHRRHIFSCNQSALRFLGGQGRQGEPLRRSDCDPILFDAIETALYGRRCESMMTAEERSWQILASPVIANGQVSGAVILLVDITEKEQREALRREFSANVSHELRTPLTSISGFAELMKDGLVPPEMAQEFAGDIYRETRRLIDLVNDIINLSRLDEGSAGVEPEPVDLYALAEEAAASLRPAAERRGISITVEGSHETLKGVRSILSEMVVNLCDNAVKYNRDGGSVAVTIGRENDEICLSVADTGIGIPYAHQSRVFERFYRVDKSHSRSVGGTGLGLSIVKHGAQYHDARIELQSEPEKGTVITLHFPLRKDTL